MTNFTMAMGSSGIVLAAVILALAILVIAFYKQILGAIGLRLPRRRRRSRNRPKSIRLDIASNITDEK